MAERYCSQGHRGCLYIGDAPHESSATRGVDGLDSCWVLAERDRTLYGTVFVKCNEQGLAIHPSEEPAEAGSRTTDKPDGSTLV